MGVQLHIVAPAENQRDEAGLKRAQRKRERAEYRLDQSEQWLRMLVDSAEDYAILSITESGKIASWSRGAEKLFGYRRKEIIGEDFAIIFTPEDREQGIPQDEIMHAQREGYSPDERWHLRKDGQRLFISGAVRPLRDQSGHVHAFLKVARDITERRHMELALRQSEERYRLLVENVKDFALFTFDLAGNITHWNPGAEQLLGYSEPEILGQKVDCLYTVEARQAGQPQKDRDAALREGALMDAEWFIRKDGRRLFLSQALRPIDDEAGNATGFVKVAHDITERKRLEDELRQARDHLETLVAERTARLQETIGELEAFSYTLTHDLRAPVRALRGLSEILQAEYRQRLGDEGTELIARMLKVTDGLHELIEDVVTLSRVTREPIHLEPIGLDSLLRELISETPALQEPNASVSVAGPLHRVFGHRASLRQCFSNLLLNAAKFVKPGVHPEVRVWSELLDRRVRIWVQDNGVGIPKEQQERIFVLFQRVHGPDFYEGTGVGLAIVRKAVERMNGKVGVESAPENGSRFWVELAASA